MCIRDRGQTWEDVIGDNLTAVSDVYGVSKVEVAADGSVTVTPVPEPSTWAMLLFGLFAMGNMARRRAHARAC